MRTMDDWELLQAYANDRSEAAFTELVQRHLDWVYSTAWRQVGDPHLAEEVAQSVFVLLARKAASLRQGCILSGWLFRTTTFVAARALRAEIRRKRREQTAVAMNPSTDVSNEHEAAWNELAPHLDQALASLSESDRAAVLLRFYEKKPLQEVGRRLGINEDAAKKRVSRSVEKMRAFLIRRGVTLGSTTLATIVAARAVEAAPAALAASVIKASFAGMSASALLPELARQTLNAWRWSKFKLAAGFVVASGACLFIAVEVQHASPKPAAPPAIRIATAEISQIPQAPSERPQGTDAARDATRGLTSTGALSGVVLDEQDHPVADAQVWAGSGYGPDAEAVTDTSGQFTLSKIGPRRTVTVMAEGFSADQQDINTNHLSWPMVFRLSSIKPLRFRVTDETGQPLAGADVALENWWGKHLSLRFRRPTDAEGRVEWHSAPKGELEFYVLKSGYRTTRQHKLVADNEQHTFVLNPYLTATGRVTDADTGEPLTSFKLTRGYSQSFGFSEETSPNWDLQDRWLGTNGFYKVVFDEENIPRLRVEAEGYIVADAKPQFTNGLGAVCDFQLHRMDNERAIRGTVFLPDGSPAADTEVALCTFQVGVWIDGTSFEKRVLGNEKINAADFRHITDAQGRFSFSPRPAAHTVVAVSAVGLGKAHCFDFTKALEIHLEPWGRIQGVVRTRNGQWAKRKIVWGALGQLHSGMDVFYSHTAASAVSDSAGSFTLEGVPPGDGQLQLEEADSKTTSCITPVQVPAGKTIQLQLGGVGAPVSGKLVAPPGVEVTAWSNQLFIAEIESQWDAYPMPEGLQGEALWRWQMEYAESEAGSARLRGQAHYRLNVQANGSFAVPEVLPGNYNVVIILHEGPLGSGPSSPNSLYMRQIATLWQKFSVPETPAVTASSINLGNLVLNPSP